MIQSVCIIIVELTNLLTILYEFLLHRMASKYKEQSELGDDSSVLWPLETTLKRYFKKKENIGSKSAGKLKVKNISPRSYAIDYIFV